MPSSPAILSVRVSPDERSLLENAAGHARTSLSDFIRRKALEAAELDLMERRIVTVPAAEWEKVEAWVNESARDIPALRRLAGTPPVWRS